MNQTYKLREFHITLAMHASFAQLKQFYVHCVRPDWISLSNV